MFSRSGIRRNAALALRKQCLVQANTVRRGMAAAASKGSEYEVGEIAGVKIATRDIPGPTMTLAVVAKAGSRYQPSAGFSNALAKFAFKSTNERSALRITRESELLGGELSSYCSRENLVLTARFFNSDLPYFAELLADVITDSSYLQHQLDEVVLPQVELEQDALAADPAAQALEAVHSLAYHRGLGNALLPSPSSPANKSIDSGSLANFGMGAYTKPLISVVASGTDPNTDVSEWVGKFFAGVAPTAETGPFAPQPAQATQYFGGEERIDCQAGNAMVIAFPGSSTFGTTGYKPEFSVLAALLGGESSIKWSPGSSLLSQATRATPGVHVSTKQANYSDAGLLYITVSGKSAGSVSQASKNAVETVKKVAAGEVTSEDIKKASALARFRALEASQSLTVGVEATGSALIHGTKPFQVTQIGQSIEKVTEQQVKQAAKALLSGKASVSAVGDLSSLPFASEIGLTV